MQISVFTAGFSHTAVASELVAGRQWAAGQLGCQALFSASTEAPRWVNNFVSKLTRSSLAFSSRDSQTQIPPPETPVGPGRTSTSWNGREADPRGWTVVARGGAPRSTGYWLRARASAAPDALASSISTPRVQVPQHIARYQTPRWSSKPSIRAWKD
jgi:hypothetical protein